MSDKKLLNIPPSFSCEKCDVRCSKLSDWNRHILTKKHTKHSLSDEKGAEVSATYACSPCGYTCNKKSLWDKHIRTAKHIKGSSGEQTVGYSCANCNRAFKCYSSLWSHKKKCIAHNTSQFTSMFEKILVNGPGAHPLYQFLKKERRGFPPPFTLSVLDYQETLVIDWTASLSST